jgi:hypothetical protein
MLSAVGRYAPSAIAYYDGEMAFVGHAHQALTAGQITTIYNNGVPLCYADLGVTLDGFYNLSNYNGNNGSELTDQVGSNNLTNVGSTPFNPTGALIVSDGGTQYNVSSMFLGGAGNADAPSSPITSLKNADQTWSIRFKPDTIANVGTQVLFTLGSIANARAFRFYRIGSQVSVATYPTIGSTSGVVALNFSVALVAGQWHTITSQVDINNTLSITVDGTKDSVAMGLHDINATYPVSIGHTGGAFYNTGSYGAFRGWNRLLSDAEVTENELNSNNVYVSYNDLSAGLKSGLIVDVDLGNYNGSNTPLVDNAGTLSFSEVGTVTYKSELAVECNEAPQITPASFSGLLVWTKGENGYTDLSGNGVPVTNNGSTITSNELNSLDVFSFNGSQHFGYGTALGKPANFTVFALVRTDDLGRNFICGSISGGVSNTSWGNLVISQTSRPTGSIAGTHSTGSSNTVTHSTDNLLSANTWHIVATTFTNGVIAQDIWIDGVKATVATTNAVTTNSGTVYTYAVGRVGNLAQDQLTGDIAEHFVYDEVRSDAEIAQLTTYLQNRYGL